MDAMDAVAIFTVVIGIAQFFGAILIGIIVWWLKKVVADIKELTRDLSNFRADVPRTYVLKEDYKDVVDRIFQKLDYLVVEERQQRKTERSEPNNYNHG